jgi:hypothetical protein
MRGHETLVAMRRARKRPALGVLIDVGPLPVLDHTPAEFPGAVIVWIEPEDRIDRLDLRCLVGLKATVIGGPDERALAAARHCAKWTRSVVAVQSAYAGPYIVIDPKGERPWQE